MDFNTFLRYKGFLETPQLWKEKAVYELNQLSINPNTKFEENQAEFKNQRLGKLVEEFIYHQLKQQNDIEWIADNLQIQNGKLTIGELDALFYHKRKPIHLEVVYKFYLYDTLNTYDEPLDYWIGPNRKDTLIFKLKKLKHKQLPLLFNPICKPYLGDYNLKHEDFEQRIAFKAQLFMPYKMNKPEIRQLNKDCISGFHLSIKQIEVLKNFQFCIPKKLDWLIIPHKEVDWLNYKFAKNLIEELIKEKRSPMLWLKNENNYLSKCFITFW